MKPLHAFLVFLLLTLSSIAAGIDSLRRTNYHAQSVADQALQLTLRQCEADKIDADTIRVYRNLITLSAIQDTAYIAVSFDRTINQPILKAHTGLTFRRLWHLSDQRASASLASLALLWLVISTVIISRRKKSQPTYLQIGLLRYNPDNRRFSTEDSEVHFTPLQHTLMELFLQAPDHRLLQKEICDTLWPKKPDASATLYTLLRRLRPILEKTAHLTLTCERGQAYQLTQKP